MAAAQTTTTTTAERWMWRKHGKIVLVCVCVLWDKKLANVRNERSRYRSFALHWGVRLFVCIGFSLPRANSLYMCVWFRFFFWTIQHRRPNNTILLQLQHDDDVCVCVFDCTFDVCYENVHIFFLLLFFILFHREVVIMAQCLLPIKL